MNAHPPLIVAPDEIRRRVTVTAAISVVRDAYLALAAGRARQPTPVHIDLPDGEIYVKGAHIEGGDLAVVKIFAGFPANVALGLPTNDGLMVAMDAATGRVVAVLLDGGWLTDIRTAAATAVVVAALAGEQCGAVTVMGTGVQARLTLTTLADVGLLGPGARVWGRDRAKASDLSADLVRQGLDVSAVADPRTAVDGAGVVVTATAARSPVLHGAWLGDDAVVVAIGAGNVGRRELDAEVFRRAAAVVTDRFEDSRHVGDLQHAVAEGSLAVPVVELGDVLAGTAEVPFGGIRVCDLVGVGVLDAAIVGLVLSGVT